MAHEYETRVESFTKLGDPITAEVTAICPEENPGTTCDDATVEMSVDGYTLLEDTIGIDSGSEATLLLDWATPEPAPFWDDSTPPRFTEMGEYTLTIESTDGFSETTNLFVYDPEAEPQAACQYTTEGVPEVSQLQDAQQDYRAGDITLETFAAVYHAWSESAATYCVDGEVDPDLVSVDCSVSPEEIAPGETTTVEATISNDNSVAVTVDVEIGLGSTSETVTVDVDPGSTGQADVTFELADTGEYMAEIEYTVV